MPQVHAVSMISVWGCRRVQELGPLASLTEYCMREAHLFLEAREHAQEAQSLSQKAAARLLYLWYPELFQEPTRLISTVPSGRGQTQFSTGCQLFRSLKLAHPKQFGAASTM